MSNLITALALIFIIEGIILFVLSERLTNILDFISTIEKKKIRIIGFFSILIGLVLLGLN